MRTDFTSQRSRAEANQEGCSSYRLSFRHTAHRTVLIGMLAQNVLLLIRQSYRKVVYLKIPTIEKSQKWANKFDSPELGLIHV